MPVVGHQLGAQPVQVKHAVNPAQQIIGLHPLIKVELVKRPIVISGLIAHHRPTSVPMFSGRRIHVPIPASTEVFNSLSEKAMRKSGLQERMR
ncbi:MAG: hypothetical protein OEQ29_01100 [Alphaproteobacteria bacterium]|nr:hypothetical protein [Alphaproteobacteria bacterium]